MAQTFKKLVKYETDFDLVGTVSLGRELAEASFNPEPGGAVVLPRLYAKRTAREAGLKLRHVKCYKVLRAATATAGEQRGYQDFVILTLDALSTISIGSVLSIDGIDWTVTKRVNEE
jgi:hypothetical protein